MKNSIFAPPKTPLLDFYERAKFKLTWRISFVFALLFGIISGITFYLKDIFFPHYFAVFLVVIIGIVLMKKRRTYKPTAILVSIMGAFLIIVSIYTVKNVPHVIQMLWMTIIVLFTFFTLSWRWGIAFIIVNCVLYVTYFNLRFFSNLEGMSTMNNTMRYIMSVEFIFAMIMIGYILKQFYTVTSYAQTRSQNAVNALRKEKETISKQDEEKTILLQEIHHRVKNNLQVIISLLRLQSNQLETKEAKQSFTEAINRILSMALIHQKMYEKDSLSTINLEDYISSLMQGIINANATNQDIKVEKKIAIDYVGTKTIVPLALLMNELISNSVKHAFDKEGIIRITIAPDSADYFLFDYFDNGTWKENESKNFGLQLLEVFTDQLEGTFERTISDEGTRYKFKLRKIDSV